MSAACSKCGDCCEFIEPSWTVADWANFQAWGNWRPWRANGNWHWAWWRDWGRKLLTRLRGRRGWDRDFVAAHWHPIPNAGGGVYRCDQFDPVARLCLAHDNRPNVCRDYPWYNRRPGEGVPEKVMLHRRCAFWADVPTANRPHDLTAFAV